MAVAENKESVVAARAVETVVCEKTPSSNGLSRLASVDSLRGWAALLVVLFHAQLRDPHAGTGVLHALMAHGDRGVQLFYVISAFTIFLTLAVREKKGSVSYRSFFVRRFFRIAPLFYCSILFYIWLYGLGPRWALGNAQSISLANIISNFLFVNGFSPYWINSVVPVGWSVAVEMTFYLCIPFLYSQIRSVSNAVILLVVSVLTSTAIFRWFYYHALISDARLWHEFLFQNIVNQFPIFILGIILFFLLRGRINSGEGKVRDGLYGGLAVFLSLSGLVALAFVKIPFIPGHFVYGLVFVTLAYGLLLWPTRVMVNPLFQYLGQISYSVYLTHVLAIRLATKTLEYLSHNEVPAIVRTMHGLSFLPLCVFYSIIIASITWRLIEVPGQKLGKRFGA